MSVLNDCRHFVGVKPCVHKLECVEGCPRYDPPTSRILIIKLAAIGDVLRTTPILPALKMAHPGCHITWMTDLAAVPLMKYAPDVDRLLPFQFDTVMELQARRFDLVICLDKEPRAVALASTVKAGRRAGFVLHEDGYLDAAGPEADYALRLGVSDELKFRRNAKTYQQIVFETCDLPVPYGEYALCIPDDIRRLDDRIAQRLNLAPSDLVIGLNTGAGRVFATKKWTIDGFVALSSLLRGRLGAQVLLLGGPEEVERNREIAAASGGDAIDTGCHYTLEQFVGLVNRCAVVVTSDTLAMHIAIALRTPVVAIFGPTCGQEVDLYGRGVKIESRPACAPCYKAKCGQPKFMACMRGVTAEQVFVHTCSLISTHALDRCETSFRR